MPYGVTKPQSLQWRHNGHDYKPHDCLLHLLFRRRSKKTSKLRVTGLCAGNSPGTVEFPAQMVSKRKMFPLDDVIMICQYSHVNSVGEMRGQIIHLSSAFLLVFLPYLALSIKQLIFFGIKSISNVNYISVGSGTLVSGKQLKLVVSYLIFPVIEIQNMVLFLVKRNFKAQLMIMLKWTIYFEWTSGCA